MDTPGYHDHKADYLKRLRRIEGHMKRALRGTSGAIVSMGLAAGALPAWGQEATQNVPAGAEGVTEIIVTGSFIRGTPVDAALPVEVYSREDLEKRGSPSALEFAKSLTIAGPTTGESYYFGGPAFTGSVNYNLRGLGSDKTLILLNGRRMSHNTANIPSLALERTEILKDGAAVIYGADAIGGVVNFITRDRFRRPGDGRAVQVCRRLGRRLFRRHSRRHRRWPRELHVVGGV